MGNNRLRTFLKDHWTEIVDGVVLFFVIAYMASALGGRLLFTVSTPTGGDMASHFPTAQYLKDHLLPQGRLIGWNPGNYCGFPLFQFYFPLPFLLMAGLSCFIPLEISFKLISVLGIFMLPLVSYFAMRLMEQRFPTPAMAAVFCLPFLFAEGNSMWGGNILSNLAGEFSYQIAFALSILFLASVFRNIRSGSHVILNGILLASIGLTHGVGFLFAGTVVLFLLMWPPEGISKRTAYLVRICALSVGFMAFWFLPFLSGLRWSTKFNLLWNISGFQKVFPTILSPYIAVAVVGSLAALIWLIIEKKCVEEERSGIKGPLAYLWFGILVAMALYETAYELNVVDIRFLPYLEFVPMLMAALVLGSVARRLRGAALLLVIVTLVTSVWVSEHSKSVSSWAWGNYSGFEAKGGWSTFRAINHFLKGSEADPRVVYEHSTALERFGTLRAFENLPYFSGRSTIEGLYIQSSITAPFAFYLQSEISSPGSCPLPQYDYTTLNIENAVKHFRLFNIGHFITITKEVQNQARGHKALDLVGTFGDVEIYAVEGSATGYVEPLTYQPVVSDISNWRNTSYRWFQNPSEDKPHLLFSPISHTRKEPIASLPQVDNPGSLPRVSVPGDMPKVLSALHKETIDIETSQPGWPLLVKVSYHPNWRCHGALGPYLASPSFMIIFPTQEKVEMRFSRSPAEWLGLGLTVLTILLCSVRCVATDWVLRREWEVPTLMVLHRHRALILLITWVAVVSGFATYIINNRSHSPARLKQKAEKAYSSGDLGAALKYYGQLLKVAPTSGYGDNANYFHAIVLWKQRDYAGALSSFRRLVSTYPHSIFVPEAMYHMGLCKEALFRYEEANRLWTKLNDEFADTKWAELAARRLKQMTTPESAYDRAMKLFDQGAFDEASALFAKIEHSSSNLTTGQNAAYFCAMCYFKMNKWKECFTQLEHLTSQDPESPWAAEANYHMAMCMEAQGDVTVATSIYKKVIEHYPESRWARFAQKRLVELDQP